jgi:hypothetical protein
MFVPKRLVKMTFETSMVCTGHIPVSNETSFNSMFLVHQYTICNIWARVRWLPIMTLRWRGTDHDKTCTYLQKNYPSLKNTQLGIPSWGTSKHAHLSLPYKRICMYSHRSTPCCLPAILGSCTTGLWCQCHTALVDKGYKRQKPCTHTHHAHIILSVIHYYPALTDS